MKYATFSTSPLQQKGDCLVLGLFKGEAPAATASEIDQHLGGRLDALIAAGDLATEAARTAWLYIEQAPFPRILCVGLGPRDAYNAETFRKVARAVAGALGASPARIAVCTLPEPAGEPAPGFAIETLVLAVNSALYRFEVLKSKRKDPASLVQLRIHAGELSSAAARTTIGRAAAVARGMNLTRDLGNLPGNHCTPEDLAREAKKLARKYPAMRAEVLREKDLKALKMGSFLSVCAGSHEEGRLIILHYRGAAEEVKPHVLIGKGITFDTGGISLKPGEAMDEMKYDMCGAASVLGTLLALAEVEAPLNVIGIIAAAENMPDGKATKPGDIVTSMSGQTIEILNTDAEGRLVLCDALTYAERFEPASVVDIATLTGACVIALGHHASGLLANDDELARRLLEAGQQSGDRCWQLPLWDDYNTQLDSNFADMQNIGGKAGGTITAACFLSRFARKFKWAHLDIAGTAWVSGKEKGATGRPVPLLTRYLLQRLPA